MGEACADGTLGASEAPKYRIGTVVQLTGLTADTIRAWERRYAMVSPARTSGGTRLYTDEDVARLQLVRALTEAGQAVGSVAGLDDAGLRERLAKLAASDSAGERGPTSRIRVALLDPILPDQLRWSGSDAAGLEATLQARDRAELGRAASGGKADVLIVHLSLLGPDPVAGLGECLEAVGAPAAVVLYEFASRKLLARLAASGARLIRGPVDGPYLHRAVRDLFVIQETRRRRGDPAERPIAAAGRAALEPPPRRYGDEQIAALREARSSLDCECLNHLAQIVTQLVAFEAYSEKCASRSPDDGELHHVLRRGTGHARAIAEDLLARLCERDAIPPMPPRGSAHPSSS